MGKVTALLKDGLSTLCGHIKAVRKTAEQAGSAAADVSQALSDHAAEVERVLNEKQDTLVGTAGQVVGFNAAGEAESQSTESLRGPQGPKGNTGATGAQGPKGDTGAAAGFGTPTASVDANVGTPSVTVTASGSNTAKVFNFTFKNLKGATGATGAPGAKGDKGDTGSQGPKGDTGATGANGKSAYQQAKEAGYSGTEEAFYAALVTLKDAPFLPTKGGTLTGNVTGKYLTGTWLQTTASTNLGRCPPRIPVLDNSGWLYNRTPAQLFNDMGGQLKVVSGSLTLPTSGWTKDNTADYPYYWDFVLASVTATDRADVIIPPASLGHAKTCGLCPTTETLAGKVRFRAVKAPTTVIVAQYWITKG